MKPETLLFLDSTNIGEDQQIEALFIDMDTPIHFVARVPFESREFFADVHSTNEGSADYFSSEDLFNACWCYGCLEPQHRERTNEIRELIGQCIVPAESNNL